MARLRAKQRSNSIHVRSHQVEVFPIPPYLTSAFVPTQDLHCRLATPPLRYSTTAPLAKGFRQIDPAHKG